MLLRQFTLLTLLFMSACGYQLAGRANNLPEKYSSISLLPAENKSFESDIGPLLDMAISEEFSRSQRLKMLRSEHSDLMLTTTIQSYSDTPSSFSASDQAREYRLNVRVDALLEDAEGIVVWKGKGLNETAHYNVVPGEASNAESSRNEAKRELAAELAETIHDSIFQGF